MVEFLHRKKQRVCELFYKLIQSIFGGKIDNRLHLCIDEKDAGEIRFSKNGPKFCFNLSL